MKITIINMRRRFIYFLLLSIFSGIFVVIPPLKLTKQRPIRSVLVERDATSYTRRSLDYMKAWLSSAIGHNTFRLEDQILVETLESVRLVIINSPIPSASANRANRTLSISTGMYWLFFILTFANQLDDRNSPDDVECKRKYIDYLTEYYRNTTDASADYPLTFSDAESQQCPVLARRSADTVDGRRSEVDPRTKVLRSEQIAVDLGMMMFYVLMHEIVHLAYHQDIKVSVDQEMQADKYGILIALQWRPASYERFLTTLTSFLAVYTQFVYPDTDSRDHPSGAVRFAQAVYLASQPERWTSDTTIHDHVREKMSRAIEELFKISRKAGFDIPPLND